MEEVLGIQPTGAGFSTVDIRPDLIDLSWAKGAEPTPHGLLQVAAQKSANGMNVSIDLPEGIVARVSVPVGLAKSVLLVNGHPEKVLSAEEGSRGIVVFSHAGHYDVTQSGQ